MKKIIYFYVGFWVIKDWYIRYELLFDGCYVEVCGNVECVYIGNY